MASSLPLPRPRRGSCYPRARWHGLTWALGRPGGRPWPVPGCPRPLPPFPSPSAPLPGPAWLPSRLGAVGVCAAWCGTPTPSWAQRRTALPQAGAALSCSQLFIHRRRKKKTAGFVARKNAGRTQGQMRGGEPRLSRPRPFQPRFHVLCSVSGGTGGLVGPRAAHLLSPLLVPSHVFSPNNNQRRNETFLETLARELQALREAILALLWVTRTPGCTG